MSDDNQVIVEIEDRLMILSMNRPDKKNAITHTMYQTMADSLFAAQEDTAIRAVLIRSTGADFTAGNDLKEFAAGLSGDLAETPVFQFLKAISTFQKPIIVGVRGLAVGIGVTMLLHSDLVYCAEDAIFSTPFTQLALVPEAGSTYLLPKVIGQAKANEMFLRGRQMLANEAAQCGLVAQIIKDDDFNGAVKSIALEMTQKAPNSLLQTKKLLRKDLDIIHERMFEEGEIFGQCLKTPEFMEVATAFMQKRAPDFSKF